MVIWLERRGVRPQGTTASDVCGSSGVEAERAVRSAADDAAVMIVLSGLVVGHSTSMPVDPAARSSVLGFSQVRRVCAGFVPGQNDEVIEWPGPDTCGAAALWGRLVDGIG